MNTVKNSVIKSLKEGALKRKKLVAVVGLIAAAVIIAAGAYGLWRNAQPKFRDVTVELGTDVVSIDQFLTEYANPRRVSFASDVSEIDLNRACDNSVTLKHGSKEETVVLYVVDTTDPAVEFITDMIVPVDYVFDAADFVKDVEEFSDIKVEFVGGAVVPVDYSDITVTVEVTDATGNSVREDCRVSFTWLKEEAVLEYGEGVKPADFLISPERDSELLNQRELDKLGRSLPGEYTVTSTNGFKTLSCAVTVVDTKGPELVVRNVNGYPHVYYDLDDFVLSASDPSGVVDVRLLTELDTKTLGVQTVVIEAEDTRGNVSSYEASLALSWDHVPPRISGLTDMTVDKFSSPDFLEGVFATDNLGTSCQVSVDTSGVNLNAGGIYYAVYTSSDESLNTATEKRKIIVNHDEEDVKALINSIADQLSNDPEEIRDYVRTIRYSTNWGGDDPVWYGFTMGSGNCYVHAHCLKALFDVKGIESQIIWVNNKTHYWLVVKIGDVWRHIDATPTTGHMVYSLMTDSQREATLGGRNWDRDAWPACE